MYCVAPTVHCGEGVWSCLPASCKPGCSPVIQASRKMYVETRASEHCGEEIESLWPHFLHHWYSAWGPVVATAASFLNKAKSLSHKGQHPRKHRPPLRRVKKSVHADTNTSGKKLTHPTLKCYQWSRVFDFFSHKTDPVFWYHMQIFWQRSTIFALGKQLRPTRLH